jgi:DNA-binding NarL/FixJ family response regulator
VRVIIAEDQALLRDGLARLFGDKGHEVVATLGSADGIVELATRTVPDLVVLDVRMPPSFTDEGATAARLLKAERPDLGVLLLSQHVETAGAADLVASPGFGYLLKDRVLEVDDFISAAERVAAGGSALDPKVIAAMLGARGRGGPADQLSEREREVLALMAEGLNNQGIATRLTLSPRTVEAHVSHLMTKLGIGESETSHRRVLAVVAYLRHGLEAG